MVSSPCSCVRLCSTRPRAAEGDSRAVDSCVRIHWMSARSCCRSLTCCFTVLLIAVTWCVCMCVVTNDLLITFMCNCWSQT